MWEIGTTRYGIENCRDGYYGEPQVNKEEQNERNYTPPSNRELNEAALLAKESVILAYELRRKAREEEGLTEEERNELRQQAKEILDFDPHYQKILLWYFGHHGWENGNLNKPLSNTVGFMSEALFKAKIRDESAFTERAWKAIDETIRNYDESKGNFRSLCDHNLRGARKMVYKESSEQEKELRKATFHMDDLNKVDDNGDIEIFDVSSDEDFTEDMTSQDAIQAIAKDIMKNVKGNKEKKQFVLEYLINHYVLNNDSVDFVDQAGKKKADKSSKFNTAECARLMVERFGGSYESHERFINRFRNKVAEYLTEKRNVKVNTTYDKKKRKDSKFKDEEVLKKNKERQAREMMAKKPSAVKVTKWSQEDIFKHVVLGMKVLECPCDSCQTRLKNAHEVLDLIKKLESEGKKLDTESFIEYTSDHYYNLFKTDHRERG